MRDLIWEFLTQGFGSEDIAVRTGAPLCEVQGYIDLFRAQGKLPLLYSRAKKEWTNPREELS